MKLLLLYFVTLVVLLLATAVVCSLLGLTFLPGWIGLILGCTMDLALPIEAFVQTEEDIRAHFGDS